MAGFEVFHFIHRAWLHATAGNGVSHTRAGLSNEDTLDLSFTVKKVGGRATTLESEGVYS
jgi:hypothetical protein